MDSRRCYARQIRHEREDVTNRQAKTRECQRTSNARCRTCLAFYRYAQQLILRSSPPLGLPSSFQHENRSPTVIEQTARPCRSLAHALCLLMSIVHGFRRPEQDPSLRSTRPLRDAQESLVFHVHCNLLTFPVLLERPPSRLCRFHRLQDGGVQADRRTDLGALFGWSLRFARPRLTPLWRGAGCHHPLYLWP